MRYGLALLVAVAALCCAGCAPGWERFDSCGMDDICIPCDVDEDCISYHSCCGQVLYCAHQDEDSADICNLGCYEPPPPPCTCIDSRCQFP